jgi:hypothetical protein
MESASVRVQESVVEHGAILFRGFDVSGREKVNNSQIPAPYEMSAHSDEGNQYSGLIGISIPGWRDQSSERSDAGFRIL